MTPIRPVVSGKVSNLSFLIVINYQLETKNTSVALALRYELALALPDNYLGGGDDNLEMYS